MDMQAFAVAMAEALDGTWTVEPGYHGHRDRVLIGPDGEDVHVCYSDWEKAPRLRLSASLPAELATIRHRHGNPAPLHEITVSPAKTPETVAAETARRLLPGYRATLAETRELKQRLDDQAAARDRLAHAIADPLGATVQPPGLSPLGCDPQEAIVRYQGPLAGTATVPRNCKHVAFAFSVASDDAAKVAAFLATFPHTDHPTKSEPKRKPTDQEMPHFTRDQVSRAVNDGADLVIDEVATRDRDDDLINLVVNAALTRLDNPTADLDQVITECYDTEPSEVRSWWSDWS
ncbi:hypothetical protein SacmaDRAFT_4160 [Saccharomonospora marina XMU15]|uniref:Uncharacterized protein n=1 Tax=Saccharomonospora marina XMU15 TaxID=882083 RepID=H5X5Z9_9PSEU|nr:hypothetical protein [Saccharomonospora marina]EHR52353.1 hypothetical protein SacmaDRAFT_4160 [Saccharomonospora marina XMU15]